MITVRLSFVAAVCAAVVVGCTPLTLGGGPALPKSPPASSLKWIFGDIKLPLRGRPAMVSDELVTAEPITEENYRKILDGLKTNLHCNGVRLYIDPAIRDPANYPSLYRQVVDYAREQHLAIYANPLETAKLRKETFGRDKAAFAEWIVAYANHFRPEFLGPFNESGWDAVDMIEIVRMIRRRLTYFPKIVGPDAMHVNRSDEELERHVNLFNVFDVIGSHNAVEDEDASAEAWRRLRRDAGKPTWATENPRPYSVMNSAGQEIGIHAVMESQSIEGLVIYLAYPDCVKVDGSLTDKGREIAVGLGTR